MLRRFRTEKQFSSFEETQSALIRLNPRSVLMRGVDNVGNAGVWWKTHARSLDILCWKTSMFRGVSCETRGY